MAILGVDDERYLDQPQAELYQLDCLVGRCGGGGRDQLTVAVAHFDLHQARTDLDALPSDEPVGYQVNDVRVGYTIALNRLSVTPSVAFSTYHYDSTTILGVPTSQAYRDRDVLQGAVTTRYELSPQRNLLVVMRVLGQHYVAPQSGMPTRNSTGYQVLVGLADDTDAVWRYRVLVGWEVRSFHALAVSARIRRRSQRLR